MAVYEINSLTLEKGADFEERIKLYNPDRTPLGINSSFTGVAKLKKFFTSSEEYPFNLFLDIGTKEIKISMASTITQDLPISGRCYFDVFLTYGFTTSITKKFVKGTIIVNDSVSK
jgi:hypothetical protein